MAVNSKLIAKNTISLYLRTLVVLIVSLYLSRKILFVLGEIDLGIYNVVGGIVTLAAFFKAAQTTSTSRFITVAIGKVDGNPRKIFAECFSIHLILALCILLLSETIGLWIVHNYVIFPLDRQTSAYAVYHLSVITLSAQFIRVPFESLMVAHEKMTPYAIFSLVEVFLKLLAILFIERLAGDKLLLYGISLCLIAVVLLMFHYLYVKLKFDGYVCKWSLNRKDFREIITFSGWTLLGSSANTATQQGVSLLFNKFVGLVANAALGFANQVNSAVSMFVLSFSTAFNPQILKTYSSGDYYAMHKLMRSASKVSFLLAYVLALPLIMNMPYVLKIWLVSVPKFTVEFCSLILICSVIDATTGVFNTAITASGKIKYYQISISISFTLDLICAFILLKMNAYPPLVFASRIVTRGFINMLIGMNFSRKCINFDLSVYFKTVIIPIICTIIVSLIPTVFISRISSELLKLCVSIMASCLCGVLCLLFVLLNAKERQSLLSFISLRNG